MCSVVYLPNFFALHSSRKVMRLYGDESSREEEIINDETKGRRF